MGLSPDAALQRPHRLAELGVRTGCDPQLERGEEHRRDELCSDDLEHRARTSLSRQVGGRLPHVLAAALGQVSDGGDDEGLLGREVMQLGAAADTGSLADDGGRRAGPAELDQAVDGRLHQALAHRAGALSLRGARLGLGGHRPSMIANSQTVKPDCLYA